MALYQVAPGAKIVVEDLNQVIKGLTGLAAHPILLDGNYGANYPFIIRQQDNSSGLIASFRNAANVAMLDITKNGLRVSTDGSNSDQQIPTMTQLNNLATSKTFYGGMTGEIRMWPNAAPPTGWLICDGSQQSSTTYPELAAILGTTFNNGATPAAGNFFLPDFRNRVPQGASGTALADGTQDFYRLVLGGYSKNADTNDTLIPVFRYSYDHTHTVNIAHNHGGVTGPPSSNPSAPATPETQQLSSGSHTHSIPAVEAGNLTKISSASSISYGTQQPSLGIHFIIRT